jgi:multimeric flavodoxin WrbA
MDTKNPRYSTSEALLETALAHAGSRHGLETRLIKLRELTFRACEGYYSKSAQACTWPCTISQQDPADGMHAVYDGLVYWADVILVATPIRWGVASSLYFKMAERLNTVQNQITLKDRVLLKDKVAGFIVTGGQDNIQAVAGQMMLFFGELGLQFPQFPFIAHSRGWPGARSLVRASVVVGAAACVAWIVVVCGFALSSPAGSFRRGKVQTLVVAAGIGLVSFALVGEGTRRARLKTGAPPAS